MSANSGSGLDDLVQYSDSERVVRLCELRIYVVDYSTSLPINKAVVFVNDQFGISNVYGSTVWLLPEGDYVVHVTKDGYNSSQNYNVTLTVGLTCNLTVPLTPVSLTPITPPPQDGGGGDGGGAVPSGCFILTALGDCNLVERGRSWRDARGPSWKPLISIYYRLSPIPAKALSYSPRLKAKIKPYIESLMERVMKIWPN